MLLNKTDSFRDYLKKEYGIDYAKPVEFVTEKIPLAEQIDYTEFSQRRREAGRNCRSFHQTADILEVSQNDDDVKTALSDMAAIGSIEALKYLTKYAENNKGLYDYWPAIARNECKGSVEYDLTGEVKIYILSPYGSVDGKIKFKATVRTLSRNEFSPLQKDIIKKEFAFQDCRHHTDTKVRFFNSGVRLTMLMPLDLPILSTIAETLSECNTLGCNIDIDTLSLKNFNGKGPLF
ncbi:MAG: hypothetical protein IKR94_11275 [Bacteroidales bacterium]|nr:hypothetical protein [Bacteroidales bacterium]MBR4215888.1 hypothetical protein [Bacteroidales bacterium]